MDLPEQGFARFQAGIGLAIGAELVCAFFENLGEGLDKPGGFAGLIHTHIKQGDPPAVPKAVMAFTAGDAFMAAPSQGCTQFALKVLCLVGVFTRPVALIGCLFLASLWISEWATASIWELLAFVIVALRLAVTRARCIAGVDAWVAKCSPPSLEW